MSTPASGFSRTEAQYRDDMHAQQMRAHAFLQPSTHPYPVPKESRFARPGVQEATRRLPGRRSMTAAPVTPVGEQVKTVTRGRLAARMKSWREALDDTLSA